MSTPAKPLPAPRAWHFTPLPGMHTKEASACAKDLLAALMPWVQKKQAARQALNQQMHIQLADQDAMSCDIYGALARAQEWDGFAVAYELKIIERWPADADLVAAIHRWSCALKKTRIEAWIARKEAAKKGRAA